MNRLIVGIDESSVAQDALLWGAQLASSLDSELVAVNCFQHPYSEMPPRKRDQLLAERERRVTKAWTAPARDAGANVRGLVCQGDPRDVLLSTVEDESADLLVLGRTGASGGPGFLHLGSLVEHAAHHSTVPLAVIPGGWSRTIKHIVVGLDGSPESQAALAWVAKIAPALDASVVALQVEEPVLEWTPASSPDNWRRDVERHIKEWTKPLTELGISVLPLAQRDLHPADGLLGVAAARHADVLVIGTRGTGGFTGLRAGGVALKVLHRANMPLILVPGK